MHCGFMGVSKASAFRDSQIQFKGYLPYVRETDNC